MAQVTDTRNGASPSGTAKPARRIGAAGLSPLDHEQAAAFSEAYAARPSAPVAVVIAAYNEEKSVGGVVTCRAEGAVRSGDRGDRGRRRGT